jgi:hypothetical protein
MKLAMQQIMDITDCSEVMARQLIVADGEIEDTQERLREVEKELREVETEYKERVRNLKVAKEAIQDACNHSLDQGMCSYCGWCSPSREITRTAKRA